MIEEEKSCRTCKWRNDNKCCCKYVYSNIHSDKTVEERMTEFIENGILRDYIKEEFDFKSVTSLFIEQLKNNLKKNMKVKLDEDTIEENLLEMIDDSIHDSIVRYLNNDNESITSQIFIEIPSEFCCKFWE